MSILRLTDLDGDLVAVESSAIVAVRVGKLAGEQSLVTLISLPGCTVAVSEPIETVFAEWQAATTGQQLAPSSGPTAYRGVFPLVAHQYPDGVTS